MERVLRLEWRDPEVLEDNPKNWRRHPRAQATALQGVMTEVGWAGAALYNERTGRLIDGHLRKKIAKKGEKIPVLIGSWNEEQEAKILHSRSIHWRPWHSRMASGSRNSLRLFGPTTPRWRRLFGSQQGRRFGMNSIHQLSRRPGSIKRASCKRSGIRRRASYFRSAHIDSCVGTRRRPITSYD
jgi:hypothetical protein